MVWAHCGEERSRLFFAPNSLTMPEAELSSLLIVDESELDCEVIGLACTSLGCRIETVTGAEEAIESYRKKKHDLVLVDHNVAPVDGIDLVRRFLKLDKTVNIVMMSAKPDDRILDFLYETDLPDLVTKPIRPKHLKEQIRLAMGRRFGRTPQKSSLALSMKMDCCFPLQGESLEIVRIRKQIADYLKSDDRGLIIEGPVGIGKPEVARFIHNNGSYGNSEYFYLDCRDIDDAELERQLISENGELGSLLLSDAHCTITLDHLEAIPLAIQEEFALVFRELSKKYHFILLAEASLDSLLDQGLLALDLSFSLTAPVIKIPDLSERPMDVEVIVRYIFAHKEDFDFEPGEDDNVDFLVAKMRRTQLDRNIDEIFERVVGRPCRRIRGEL